MSDFTLDLVPPNLIYDTLAPAAASRGDRWPTHPASAPEVVDFFFDDNSHLCSPWSLSVALSIEQTTYSALDQQSGRGIGYCTGGQQDGDHPDLLSASQDPNDFIDPPNDTPTLKSSAPRHLWVNRWQEPAVSYMVNAGGTGSDEINKDLQARQDRDSPTAYALQEFEFGLIRRSASTDHTASIPAMKAGSPMRGEGVDLADVQHAFKVATETVRARNHIPTTQLLASTASSGLPCPHLSCSSKILFTRRCDLNKHYRTHIRNHFCRANNCKHNSGRSTLGFATKKDRDRHEKTHNPSMPCSCCGKLFSRSDGLRAHFRRQHQR